MPRRCSKCQSVYGDEQKDIQFCPTCGNLPEVVSPLSASLPEFVIALDEDTPAHAGDSWPTPQAAAQDLKTANAGQAIVDERYLRLPEQSKSPLCAALLSFLLVGMGQVYLGQVEKGLTMLGIVFLLMVMRVLGPLGLIIVLLNVLDAFLLAQKINERKPIRKWEFFFQSG